jgi:cytochrome oxidase assembly protein ShyY1
VLGVLAKPRWILLLILTLVISGTCVRLGIWQMHRWHDVKAYNASVTAGLSRSPTPLDELLPPSGPPSGASPDLTALRYRLVVATGSYDAAHEVVLYGRTLNEAPGNHLLTPLLLADGRAVIVDRGWVPFDMSKPPVEAATPPSGSVEVTGVLEPTEPPGSGPKAGPVQLVTTVDLQRLAPQMPYPLLPMYVRLRLQVPAQSGSLPAPAPLPPLTEGPYQGYMLQWFAFASIFLGGYCVLVWREARDRRASHTHA